MDPTDLWLSIATDFPIHHPPDYDMLVLTLSSRARLCVVPVVVMHTVGVAPILRFAVPGNTIPQSRVAPRAGPLFVRSREAVRATETQDGDCVLDSNGDEESIEVDMVDASPAVLSCISRYVDTEVGVKGFKAFGPEDGDGAALLPVWPLLQDLLDISVSYTDRPSAAYDPDELVPPARGTSWNIISAASKSPYVTGASGSDRGAPASSSQRLPVASAPPVIAGLDPAEVSQALQSGVSRDDLEAFARVAFTVPQAARPPLLGARSPSGLNRQWASSAPQPAPPTQSQPAAAPAGAGVPPDFFAQLTAALQQGLRPAAQEATPLDRALAGLGGGSLDTDGSGSLRRQGRARLLLCQALSDEPAQFSGWVDRALADAFPSRPANARPTMREYVEHRSKFSSSHRPSMLAAWSVAGARDALRNGFPEQALARLDVLMVALEQISIDSGSLLMAQELLWEAEPPTIAYSASSADGAWRKPVSALCAPEWAEVAFARLRDLDDWALRKQRLTNMGPNGKGQGRGKGKQADIGDHGGAAAPDAPAAPPARRRANAKGKGGKAPNG